MTYRPQYVTDPTPPGAVDEEFEYYFDQTNTPGLLQVPTVGSPINRIVLQLQNDAEFIWRAIQISGNTGPLCLRFYDPNGNELVAMQVEADRAYSASLQALNPIGRLPVVFEPEVRCPSGGFLQLDLLLLA